MKAPTFKCPNCGNNLGTAQDAYLYGSPFRICNKCKKSYFDNRYHEIAIDGIRPQDINPSEEDIKAHRKAGLKAIWIGVGSLALFILILFTGWIVFPLPIVSVYAFIAGARAMKVDTQKQLEKKRKALEIERQQSILRMQNPEYVEQLRALGYNIPTNESITQAQQSEQKFCASCGTPIEQNNRFCPKCGKPV